MNINPSKIWEEFKSNRISKLTTVDSLTSLIENSNKNEIRLEAITTLVKLIPFDNKLYSILENLIVSDESKNIRYTAIKYLGKFFFDKAFSPLNWAIKNETDFNCLIEIVKQ